MNIDDIPLTSGSTLQLNVTDDLDSTGLITGSVVRNTIDSNKLVFTLDSDTLPSNTETALTKIVNPLQNYPGDGTLAAVSTGQRYLLTNEIVGDDWGISADKDDIVEYDGSKWFIQ